MTRALCAIAGLGLAAVLLLPAAARADDQDTIDYRRHIMKTMGEQAAAIGQILQQKAPPDNFAIHVQILAITAATAQKAFAPKVLGGEAKPDVWTNWADFSKRLDVLTAATADLAKTAAAGGVAATAPKIQAAMTCKSCHEIYHEPKKQ
jgi:cytochrome c556